MGCTRRRSLVTCFLNNLKGQRNFFCGNKTLAKKEMHSSPQPSFAKQFRAVVRVCQHTSLLTNLVAQKLGGTEPSTGVGGLPAVALGSYSHSGCRST